MASIESVNFSVLTEDDAKKISVVNVTERLIYDDKGPVDNGLRDASLGPTARGSNAVCVTCGDNVSNCAGHFGHIDFALPLFHINRAAEVVKELRARCKTCGEKKCKDHTNPKVTWSKNCLTVNGKITCAHEVEQWLGDAKHLLLRTILVPPNPVRPPPTVGDEEIMGEDSTTRSLLQIIRTAHSLKAHLSANDPQNVITSIVNGLQKHVNTYIDRQRATKTRGGDSLADRFRGKTGRFRGNGMGKRVNFCARAVVTGDAMMDMRNVGVPRHIANIVTKRVRVTEQNRETLMKMNGFKIKTILRHGNRYDMRYKKGPPVLFVGDEIERTLMDGDIVLFNRQPSLHRMSIMAHRAQIMDNLSFRLNLSCTPPYNADFDGDEMNMHVPQTLGASAEAMELLAVENNFITPASHHPCMSVVQDALLCMYEMTGPHVRLTFAEMCQWYMYSGVTHRPMPERKEIYTGHEAASIVFPVQLFYERGDVKIIAGNLISGRLNKKVLGRSDGSLMHCIVTDFGGSVAADTINAIQRGVSWWCAKLGFSIGIKDMVPDDTTVQKMQTLYEQAIGKLGPNPTEHAANQILNSARDGMGKLSVESVKTDNCLGRIIASGAKGSNVNLMQISGAVGQQNCEGKLMKKCIDGRTLPCFKKGDNSPEARGFVRSPYIEGLKPHEFVFHAVGGREGLCDTAIKTSQTGYVQRRLVKAMETLKSHYDGTIRNSENSIVQFMYGDDGFDGIWIEKDGGPSPVPIPMRRILRRFNAQFPMQGERKETSAKRVLPKFHNAVIDKYIRDALEEIGEISDEAFTRAMNEAERRYHKGKINAGECVGIIAAQSIGEQITQLSLDSFHSAGISANTNVALGVPRMEELINASKQPKIKRMFFRTESKEEAFALATSLRETQINDLVNTVQLEKYNTDDPRFEIYTSFPDVPLLKKPDDLCVIMTLSTKHLAQKAVSVEDVANALRFTAKGHRAKDIDVHTSWERESNPTLRILFHKFTERKIHNWIFNVKKKKLKGMEHIKDAVITDEGVETTGVNLLEALARDSNVLTDDVFETLNVLGVEAAREVLFREIQRVLECNGAYVSKRHIQLLVDWMTLNGNVRGTTRHGHECAGPLQKATYEQPVETLTQAALHKKEDNLKGVSEQLLMGKYVSIGSKMCNVISTKEMQEIMESDQKRKSTFKGQFKFKKVKRRKTEQQQRPAAPAQTWAKAPAWGDRAQPRRAPAWGQPQAPAWGQPQTSAWGQPQAPVWGQPQTTTSQASQPWMQAQSW